MTLSLNRQKLGRWEKVPIKKGEKRKIKNKQKKYLLIPKGFISVRGWGVENYMKNFHF